MKAINISAACVLLFSAIISSTHVITSSRATDMAPSWIAVIHGDLAQTISVVEDVTLSALFSNFSISRSRYSDNYDIAGYYLLDLFFFSLF